VKLPLSTQSTVPVLWSHDIADGHQQCRAILGSTYDGDGNLRFFLYDDGKYFALLACLMTLRTSAAHGD
jgi:hypothetical protein